MRLPEDLQAAIEGLTEGIGLKALSSFSKDLTSRYREGKEKEKEFMFSEGHRLAYLASRFPATYAAIVNVLEEVKRRAFAIEIKSVADVGAGPGTGMWAALDVFQSIEKVTLYEKDRELMRIGKSIVQSAHRDGQKIWKEIDLKQSFEMEEADLVLISYAIGEIPPSYWTEILRTCWDKTGKMLVIIEPGTPVGFERIRALREMLIGFGGTVIAPCPHQNKCPLPIGDWCHFDVRLERSFTHRHIKEGSLGYEDEKFSYIALAKEDIERSKGARILRTPLKRPGNVSLSLCGQEGLYQKVVTKKTKEPYKKARKSDWGDWFEPLDS